HMHHEVHRRVVVVEQHDLVALRFLRPALDALLDGPVGMVALAAHRDTCERTTSVCGCPRRSPNASSSSGPSACMRPIDGRAGLRPGRNPEASSRRPITPSVVTMCTGTSHGAPSPETSAGG